MPKIMRSTGTGADKDTALFNAKATLSGPMNNAGESRIVSTRVEQTADGYIVTIEVELLEEDEVQTMAPGEEGGEEEGAIGAVIHGRREVNNISDIAHLQSAQALANERAQLFEQALEEAAHPENYVTQEPIVAPPVESEFDEAAHTDAAYIHRDHDHDNDNPETGGRIVTEIVQQEIEDSVRHDVLSAGVVEWASREPPPPELAPDEPALEDEGLTPEERAEQDFQKKAKQAPDELDLVA